MAGLRVWYDEEGDFLEVTFSQRTGHFQQIRPDVYERVDEEGNILGFAIFGARISRFAFLGVRQARQNVLRGGFPQKERRRDGGAQLAA